MLLKKPRYLLVGLGTLAVATAALLLGIGAHNEYERDLVTLQKQLEAQAVLLSEHAESSFSAAELILTEVASEVQLRRLDGYVSSSTLWGPMYRTVMRSPQIGGMLIADAHGETVFIANKLPNATIQGVAQYDFFQTLRDGSELHIGAPITVRDSDDTLIPVSGRLQNSNGEFVGVVAVLLDAAYFKNFYTRAQRDLDLRIGMFREDGESLILYPAPTGAMPSGINDAVEQILAHDGIYTSIVVSPLDRLPKIVSLRNLSLYPVALSVAYDYQAFLQTLQPTFIRYGMIFLVLSSGITLAIYLLDRSIRNSARLRDRQLKVLRKQQETEQLCHAIARNIPNGNVVVFDRELRYVFADGQEWRNSAGKRLKIHIGQPIHVDFPDEASEMLQSLGQNALAGHKAEAELRYGERIYKITAVPLPGDHGEIHRALALSQDITSFKEDQQKLERLNRQLHILSTRDELLGVANRREFDRLLEQEWRRCARERLPLGLLMIDVDYFKRYNDAYGHPAGDACLQQIAAVLKESAARPGDRVARYGGEELVILLPSTDIEGTQLVAERVHSALAARALPFADSLVSDHVTVSIGAASRRPRHDQAPEVLLKEADTALYSAKHEGRDRTVTALPA
ncbi:diguanylate cyclase domain-containing protein [Halomonas sp. WWR20]